MNRAFRLFAFAILLTGVPASLPARADPGEAWSTDSKLTTPVDDAKIAGWWADASLPAGEAERRTFDLLLARRLEQVPASVRRAVLEDRALRVYFEAITAGESDGAYLGLTRRVTIKLPADLKFSTTYYSTLMHELEHAVQRHAHGIGLDTARKLFDWSGRNRSLAEKEAMTAEWHYLRSIPEDDRLRIAAELEASPYASMLAVDIDNHRFAGGTLEDYLEYQWKTGRNNPQTIERKARETTRSLCRGILVIGGGFGSAHAYCSVLHAKRSETGEAGEAPTFYRLYCQRVLKMD